MKSEINSKIKLQNPCINQQYLDKTLIFAKEQNRKYGATIHSLWDSKDSQKKCFEDLFKIGDLNNKSILDLGCGFGDLYQFLIDNNIHIKDYLGVDICQEFIDIAKTKYPYTNFEVRNIYKNPFNESEFDYVIASGIFSIPIKGWDIQLISAIDLLLYFSRIGIGFNLLVSEKPIEYPLYYSTMEIINPILRKFNPKIIENKVMDSVTIFINKNEV
jgi:SAM-dependent methyltransferase